MENGLNIWNTIIRDENSFKRKNKTTVSLKTGRFNNIDQAVIVSSVGKAVQNCKLTVCCLVYIADDGS